MITENREVELRASLWRHPNFVRLWTSETISSFGAQFSELAIPLTAVLVLNGTPAQLGILNATITAPFLVFSLVAGVWVDRHRRRSVMVATNIGRAFLLALIPLSAATGVLTIPLLLLLAFSIGTLRVFFDIAYQSFLPSLVQREQLVDANSRLEASRAVSSVAGPSAAGTIVQLVTAPFAVAFDAISFIFSTLFLAGIQTEESPSNFQDDASVLAGIKKGLGLVGRDARLRSLAGAAATANFFEFAIQAIFFLYAVDMLGLQPETIGIILGVGALGAVAGALTAGKLAKLMGVGPSIIASMILGAGVWGPLIYLATRATAVPLLVTAWFVGEVSFVAWSINQGSLRQAICPPRLQGRVNATVRFLSAGAVPLGSIAGGLLGEIVGLRLAIGVASIGLVLSPLWILFSPVRRMKRVLDDDVLEDVDRR